MILYQLKQPVQGGKIFKTAISMLPTMPANSRQNAVFLWTYYADMEYMMGNIQGSINILVSFALKDQSMQPATHTKMTQAIELMDVMLDQAMQLSETKEYTVEMERFLSLLQNYMMLLYHAQEIEKITQIYKKCTEQIISKHGVCLMLEVAYQQICKILYLDSKSEKRFKPSAFGELIDQGLFYFPNNSMFLSMSGWNEARFKVRKKKRMEESPQALLMAIWLEVQKDEANEHIIKRLFDKAVDKRYYRR
jgi:hypothetical protein